MKRINLDAGVTFDVIRSGLVDRNRNSTFNGGGNPRFWTIVIKFEGRTFAFPYRRGPTLMNNSAIDTTAVFRAVMLEQAALAVSLNPARFYSLMWGADSDAGISRDDLINAQGAWDRAIKMQTGLKRVLGAEYDRCLQIVLGNLQEQAHAPATA